MVIKSQDSDEVIIYARADPVHQSVILLISRHMKDWEVANVKTSYFEDIQDGKPSASITITFAAAISELSEITSSTK